MIVVLAQPLDAAARGFVERSGGEAALLTVRELSEAGWSHSPTGSLDSDDVSVIGGQRVAPSDISAVVTRIPAVAPETLRHIDPRDRVFVAAEMNAFLLSWLTKLEGRGCVVVNRATAGSLMGPAWSRERWLAEGCRNGFEPFARAVPVPLPAVPPTGTRTIVVAGDACIGDASPHLRDRARGLARRTGVTLMGFCVDEDDRLILAEPWPDIAQPDVASALLSLLRTAPNAHAAHRGAA